MRDLTVNRFRTARGKILAKQIIQIKKSLGRDIRILDIGGRAEYWDNVGTDNIQKITILNNDPGELKHSGKNGIFSYAIGDARDLSPYKDESFDLAHSNSVIEHVGAWRDMRAMAEEARRVGISGWVQTPAWEFPIEPHFKFPFLHWFSKPIRQSTLSLLPHYRNLSSTEKRWHIDQINLLSRRQFGELFPDCEIFVERLVLAKSYVARWGHR